MHSEIERAVEGIIVTIQMWIPLGIPPISSSSHSVAVIAEAVEVDSKLNLLNPFSLLKLKYSNVACACINKTSLHIAGTLFIFRVINFRGFHCPRKFLNNEIFPDYGIFMKSFYC